MRIQESTTVRAPIERVWPLLADLDGEPRFWKGVVATRTLSRAGDVVEREVTLAFRNSLQREKVYLHPPVRVVHEILGGPMRGTKVVAIEAHDDDPGVKVRATWDVTLRGFLKIGTPSVKRHIAEGTRNALQRIKEAAEGTGGNAARP